MTILTAADELRFRLRGGLHVPGHPEYADACELFNAMIETRPRYVARCTAPDDVIAALAFARDEDLAVAVRGGGCSGFQYALAFDRKKDDDHVFEHSGVAVLVDKVSMQFVFGSEVDYVEGLQGAGFKVDNPNVIAACGCGSSFRVAEEEEVSAV